MRPIVTRAEVVSVWALLRGIDESEFDGMLGAEDNWSLSISPTFTSALALLGEEGRKKALLLSGAEDDIHFERQIIHFIREIVASEDLDSQRVLSRLRSIHEKDRKHLQWVDGLIQRARAPQAS